jgi:tetratricopeptide (TPR) repeat protein
MEKSKAFPDHAPPVMTSLSDAVALHQQGRLPEAQAAYRALLAQDPDNPDALFLLGVVALQTDRPAEAVPMIQAAISRAPGRPQYHFNHGSALGQTGRPDEAIAAYDRALALQPDYPEAARDKAAALIALGRLAEAQAALDHALRLRPDDVETVCRSASVALSCGDFAKAATAFAAVTAHQPAAASAHAGTGLALAGLGRLTEALRSFDESTRLDPANADTHANRGLTLYRHGRHEEALAALDAALHRQPAHAMALDARGSTLHALGRLHEALASHDAALEAFATGATTPAPYLAVAHTSRGATLHALSRHQEALAAHDLALTLNPNNAEAHNNRATSLQALGRYSQALSAYDRAIVLRSDYAEALSNKGSLLQMTGHAAQAMTSFDAALALRPDDANLRFDASLCRLLLGHMAAGWRDFEARWDHRLMRDQRRNFPQPRWQGETSGTVLLHAEQGFGDTLQFCRYAPLAAARGVKVVLEVQAALGRLLSRLDPRVAVLPRGATLPRFDWHCPLMSLPLIFDPQTPPAAGSYLHTDPGRVEAWRNRLSHWPGRKIGLVWAGSPRHHVPELREADRRRSLALRRLAPLARVPGVTFVSLQKGEAANQAPPAGLPLLDLTHELADFEDTASLVQALDLVISVDTAMVHLAGGLGVPVWVLNRFDTCWRWQLGRTDSPWYRSATLFRQPALGDWDSVIEAVAVALEEINGQAI